MKNLKIIPVVEMIFSLSRNFFGLGYALSFALFFALGIVLAWQAINSGDLMGPEATTAYGIAMLFTALYWSPTYKPGKSFAFARKDKNFIDKTYKLLLIALPFFALIRIAMSPSAVSPYLIARHIVIAAGLMYAIYLARKSIKLHGDVDFAANQELARAIGATSKEKALISYQDFDRHSLKAGSSVFLVTALNITVARYNGKTWSKLTRRLQDLRRIGWFGTVDQQFIKLVFDDMSSTIIRLELHNKLTSNPDMIFKKLLDVIDSSLVSSVASGNLHARRRVSSVSIASPRTSEKLPEQSPNNLVFDRVIEVSTYVPPGLESAAEIPRGRALEV